MSKRKTVLSASRTKKQKRDKANQRLKRSQKDQGNSIQNENDHPGESAPTAEDEGHDLLGFANFETWLQTD